MRDPGGWGSFILFSIVPVRVFGYNARCNWKFALGQQFQLAPILDNPGHWRRRDYMVIYVRRRDEERWQAFLETNDLRELRAFRGENARKGRVAIVATGSQPGAD